MNMVTLPDIVIHRALLGRARRVVIPVKIDVLDHLVRVREYGGPDVYAPARDRAVDPRIAVPVAAGDEELAVSVGAPVGQFHHDRMPGRLHDARQNTMVFYCDQGIPSCF